MNYVSADGQVLPNLIFYTEVTAQSNGENITVQAIPSSSCVINVIPKKMPQIPASGYSFLAGRTGRTAIGGLSTNGDIVRSNGTVGSDGSEVIYNYNTGIVTIGGEYGKTVAGETYCVYQVEIPTE